MFMRKLGIFCTVAAVVCSAVSCGQGSVATVDVASGFEARPDSIGIESIAQEITAISLKADSLYDIRIFGESGGKLYGRTADNVFVIFSEDGTLLNAYDREGRGPGEYVSPTFKYDYIRDEILIIDFQNKVIRYDADGNFIDEVRNDVTGVLADIEPIDEEHYVAVLLSHAKRDSSLLYLDRNLNVRGSALPIFNQAQTSARGLIISESIERFNSEVMYLPSAEETYYCYRNGDWLPYLRLDQGKYRMPADLSVTVGQYDEKAKYFAEMGSWIAGRYVFVCYVYYGKSAYYYDVYDVKTGGRLVHNMRSEEEVYEDDKDGYILRYEGNEYAILPQHLKDNVIYCSVFGEDGSTTLLRLSF